MTYRRSNADCAKARIAPVFMEAKARLARVFM
jgi:hypothetical protein